jgi:hypothetical protein
MKNLLLRNISIKILIIIVILFCSCISKKDIPVIQKAEELHKYVNKKVTVTGKISQVQWQHVIKHFTTHPFALNFDMNDLQIIVYSKENIDLNKELKITGKVIKVAWNSKKAGDNSNFAEYHIIADNYEIIN